MIREVLALTKGVTDPEVTFPLKNVLQRIEMRMPFVISVLCFVSRMRKQDGGFTNWIPLGRRAFTILYRFFSRAAMSRTVGIPHSPHARSGQANRHMCRTTEGGWIWCIVYEK